MNKNHETYMRRCYELAVNAGKKGFDTFGAILVSENKIIAEAENTSDCEKGIFGHAEFNLVHKCANRCSDEIYENAVFYTSCAPCVRCLMAIASLGIKTVVFGVSYKRFQKLLPFEEVIPDYERLLSKMKVPVKMIGPVLEEEGMHAFEYWGGEYRPLEELIQKMDEIKRNNGGISMNHMEKYKQYFTKEYLMGPNSFRLLDELIRRSPGDANYKRTLDLGCGFALTSLFIANETSAESVVALDLWVTASENFAIIKVNHLEDKIIPIHGDALSMPFAEEYFDAIISVDSYHYFGCKKGVFAEKILPFVKRDGYVMIAIPGLKEAPEGELKELFTEWAEGDDAELFQTVTWWETLLKEECDDRCDITVKEAECFDVAWKEWFDTGHEFGLRDKEYLEKGLDKILNFILIYVKKR